VASSEETCGGLFFFVVVLEYRCEGVGIYLYRYLVVENLLVILF